MPVKRVLQRAEDSEKEKKERVNAHDRGSGGLFWARCLQFGFLFLLECFYFVFHFFLFMKMIMKNVPLKKVDLPGILPY
jgi:hypothetical protein